MYGPEWPFLPMCVSRDTRRRDFPQVDGWSTDTLVLGRHKKKNFHFFNRHYKKTCISQQKLRDKLKIYH